MGNQIARRVVLTLLFLESIRVPYAQKRNCCHHRGSNSYHQIGSLKSYHTTKGRRLTSWSVHVFMDHRRKTERFKENGSSKNVLGDVLLPKRNTKYINVTPFAVAFCGTKIVKNPPRSSKNIILHSTVVYFLHAPRRKCTAVAEL